MASKNKIDKLRNDPEEFKRCQDDPLYFHNKYVKYEGKKDLTQEEFDAWTNPLILKGRSPNHTLTSDQFFKLFSLTSDKAFKKSDK